MRAQAVEDAKAIAAIQDQRDWERGVNLATEADAAARANVQVEWNTGVNLAVEANHLSQMASNPTYRMNHEWETGVDLAVQADRQARAQYQREWDFGVQLAERAHATAMLQAEKEWYRGASIAERAEGFNHYLHPGAAAESEGGFNAGIMTGSLTGIAAVLGAYFIMKMFCTRSKMHDDFERA